ncbi:hypothetical protein SAMN05428975_2116 [Mucilaginibacter sp. OK268]|nr:hypothetical protein SAMN05428975_2116 [Mucilaginibacter sp. OK268]
MQICVCANMQISREVRKTGKWGKFAFLRFLINNLKSFKQELKIEEYLSLRP